MSHRKKTGSCCWSRRTVSQLDILVTIRTTKKHQHCKQQWHEKTNIGKSAIWRIDF